MRLGWIVLAHDRPGQVARLVSRLSVSGDRVFLHVDGASPIEPFQRALDRQLDGLVLVGRQRSRWGSYGVVSATLAGMRAALDDGADYLHVISGQDYPIKPVEALRTHLIEAQGAAFMHYFALPNPDWGVPEGGMWRLNRRHYRLGRFHFQVPNRFTPFIARREMPRGLAPFAGSNWFSLPRDCAAYIFDFLERNPRVVDFYRRAALPAESLFHTILLNGPLRENVVFNDLRFIVWAQGLSHPQTLDSSHIRYFKQSPAFLARKFDAERDPRVLDEIDEQLLGVAPGS